MKNNRLMTTLFLLAASSINAQNLTAVEIVAAEPVIYGEVLWLDINNDDRMELIIAGDGNEEYILQLFDNEGLNELTLNAESEMEPLTSCSIDKADFNNDGFMDFVMSGLNEDDLQITNLYLNEGDGTFTMERLDMIGTTNGKIRTADFNNDSYADIILTGIDTNFTYVANLYFQTEPGEFTLQDQALMGNYFGDITIFDADNDGDSDLLLTGFDNTFAPNAAFYLNDGEGILEPNEDSGFEAAYFTGGSASDYDNDGDMDVLVSGSNSAFTPQTWVYENDGAGTFTVNADIELLALFFGTTQFVDVDGNETQDIFLSGGDNDGVVHSVVYLQDEDGEFTLNEVYSDTIIDVNISSTKWTDYDNDGDNDLMVTGFNFDGDLEMMFYTNDLYAPTYANIPETENIAFDLFPNPSKGDFQIRTDYNGHRQLTISDISGNIIFEQSENFPIVSIETELATGIYFVQVKINNEIATKKLIIK